MLDNLGASAQGNLSADASVSADGSMSADASASASGGAGGPLAAALSAAASFAASAQANLAASASMPASQGGGLTAQASFGAGAKGKGPGVRLPDPWLVFRFQVTIQGIGPVSFQSISGLSATMQAAPPPTPRPAPTGTGHPTATTGGTGRTAGSTPPATTPPASNVATSNSGNNGAATTLPATAWSWGKITLKRGMAEDGVLLWTWLLDAVKGHTDPRWVTITLLDNLGLPAMTWHINKAFPSKWTFPNLDTTATGNLVNAIEALELTIQNNDVTILFT